jgi:hypothetical protein
MNIFFASRNLKIPSIQDQIESSAGVFPDAIAVSVSTASVSSEIRQDRQAHPDPIKADHTTRSDNEEHQGCPGCKDQPQNGPDETLENRLIIYWPDQPPD